VLTTANTKINGFTYLPKHGGARDNKFLVINDLPTLLDFRDRTPKRTDRGAIAPPVQSLVHSKSKLNMSLDNKEFFQVVFASLHFVTNKQEM
jgi:hypothetical protein